MFFIKSFLFCGLVCLIGQLILDNTKLTPGHVTSLFVVIGAFLGVFDIYDILVKWAGAGALIPITSFGHSLLHAAFLKAKTDGVFGLLAGMFSLTSAGIVSAIIFSFFITLICKPRD